LPTFSPSDAALEGFSVLRRHWRAALGWGLFNIVALVALAILLVVAILALVPVMPSPEAARTIGAVLSVLFFGLGGGLVQLVIICGVYRLELRPEAPGFLHMRVGRDELRVLGAALLLGLIALPLMVLVAIATRLAAQASGFAALAVVLVGLICVYAVMVRFGLTPAIAFAEGRISPAESWRLTRGQTWRLLGMTVLLAFVILLLAAFVWVAVFVINGLTTGFRDFGLSGAEAFEAHPGRYLFEAGVELLLAPFWMIVGQSPWIAVYRALKGEPAA
jgi:hypothetical protein